MLLSDRGYYLPQKVHVLYDFGSQIEAWEVSPFNHHSHPLGHITIVDVEFP